jgi:hypothetical protein
MNRVANLVLEGWVVSSVVGCGLVATAVANEL